jgi:superfamily I DNA/RNA helicase
VLELGIARGFLEEYAQLEKRVRVGVERAISKFQRLTAAELHADKGLHLESVENARDPRIRTIRITDFWRGIVLAPDDGSDLFLLVHVVQHDKAYEWAVKRMYSVNSATRGLEMRNVDVIEQVTPLLEQAAAQAPARLFEKHSDAVLRQLGIDDALLPAVRTFTDADQLSAFMQVFPEDQWEVLLYLSEGCSPEEVWRDLVSLRRPADSEPLDQTNVSAAIINTPSRIVLVSRPDELEQVLGQPFAAWRVFLHPSQRRVAYQASYGGPAYVSGGPGTGKTVVALHRVKHLLDRLPVSGEAGQPVLLATYTNALAASLRRNLRLLVDAPEQLSRVETGTVDSLAHRVFRELSGRVPRTMDDVDERNRWRALARKLGLPWSGDFLMQEFRHVVLAQDLRTEAEYTACERRGRGSGLSVGQRPLVWQAMEEFTGKLDAEGRTTHLRLCADAARLLSNAGGQGPAYRHIVVDEAQDLHPAQWRLLRAAASQGPDDLFAVGDPHQRIYDSKVSLSSLGIPVKGRSFRLRINYRNTEEILRWAVAVLEGQHIESLAGDGLDSLTGYASLIHGANPSMVGYPDEGTELAALVEQVERWLEAEVPSADIAVCSRFQQLRGKVIERLRAAGIDAVLLKDAPDDDIPGVRIATMHAMKGLEFRCVALLGAAESAFPFTPAVTPLEADPLQHAVDLLAERCLLFVASTRAREALAISWSGQPSPFLSLLDASVDA